MLFTTEDEINILCGGDFTKFEALKNMKVSEVQKLAMVRRKESYLTWYAREIEMQKIEDVKKNQKQ